MEANLRAVCNECGESFTAKDGEKMMEKKNRHVIDEHWDFETEQIKQ